MVFNTLEEFHKYVSANSDESKFITDIKLNRKPIINIHWQNGGTATSPKNGAFLEEVLAVVYAQLAALNREFPCRENSLALTKIEEAVLWLAQRKAERENRNVYGKDKK
jgi:hypothetical protein